MWGDGRLKYIYFTSLHFFAHPTNLVGRVSVRTPSPQGLSVAPTVRNLPRQKTLTLREFFAYSVQYYDTVPPNENTFFGIFVDHDISLLNQKLFIFVFKPETLRNFTPEQLVERNYCDGKFFLNCADLDRANYSFSYNGE